WAAASVYLIHPVHTEAVVWMVGWAELLAAAFFFGAWLLFRRGGITLASVLFLFSLLSKENAIVFPAIVALEILMFGGGTKKLFEAWRSLIAVAGIAITYLTV